MIKLILVVLGSALLLAGCASNDTYRGISSKNWNALNHEQKQIVVNKAYQKQVEQTQPMHVILTKGK